jgi:hypothetical protein
LAIAPGISYRFLLGAMQQNKIALTVRFMAVDHEVQRLLDGGMEGSFRADANALEWGAGGC